MKGRTVAGAKGYAPNSRHISYILSCNDVCGGEYAPVLHCTVAVTARPLCGGRRWIWLCGINLLQHAVYNTRARPLVYAVYMIMLPRIFVRAARPSVFTRRRDVTNRRGVAVGTHEFAHRRPWRPAVAPRDSRYDGARARRLVSERTYVRTYRTYTYT